MERPDNLRRYFMKENWKQIDDSDYYISNLGRVKSKIYKHNERILKTHIDRDGYEIIRLHAIDKTTVVHKLVAIAFVDNPENKKYVNHIDGIKSNNTFENLEWVTASENMKHAFDNGLCTTIGDSHFGSKLNEDLVRQLRYIKANTSISYLKLAEKLNLNEATIMRAIKGQTWKHV